MRRATTAATIVLALGAGACEEATGPAQEAEVRVTMEASGEGSVEPSRSAAPQGISPSSAAAGAESELEVRARVYVQSAGGQWIELTRGAAEQVVDVSGEAGATVLATGRVSARQYHRARVEFERVTASSAATLELGLGSTDGEVRVELGGDGRVVVEREVELRAEAGAGTELRIQLNAEKWLSRVDAESRTVAEAEFRQAVTLVAR